ncbi:MAG: MAPEG family protein [Alphaproteobacteria bacterium]|jgi:uncharacterized MAPEG superfamily protein|nr:hypothetical protein [Rhodospirillaceae bacterium]MDP6022274.1 MAPEG family protein [Alphaproteobacteria bacterium]MDP6253992.1 MAPEG family protein [Alphaproteobacteria bacterium]MDP7053068.1 MAPEG family protein [Alphaproteobacteria bacterium]MDP7227589.1 MAPEG family protein [Alphaproteobacteria bacterium]|tara:strand:+ start:80 stop:472 length:393 start_codon:yes stop_codon:yes gene_type:complete
MTVELTMLFWAVVLTFAQLLVAVLLAIGQLGLTELTGNREGLAPPSEMAGRAKRAHANMLESLVLFAILILVVQVAGLNNEMTALGAQIFVFARLVYAVVYIVGVPWLRTVIWAISVVGMVIIALPILAA